MCDVSFTEKIDSSKSLKSVITTGGVAVFEEIFSGLNEINPFSPPKNNNPSVEVLAAVAINRFVHKPFLTV